MKYYKLMRKFSERNRLKYRQIKRNYLKLSEDEKRRCVINMKKELGV